MLWLSVILVLVGVVCIFIHAAGRSATVTSRVDLGWFGLGLSIVAFALNLIVSGGHWTI